MALVRRRSGLRQATKTDKMLDKKIKDVRKQYHTIVIMYILWSNDRFGFKASVIIYTRVRDKKRLVKVGNLVKNSYLYR